MTLLFSAVAAGTVGGAVTTGNSPFTNLVTPGAWTYSNTRVVPGYGATVAWRATASSGTALANAGSSVWASAPVTFWDVAFDVESLPSTNETIIPFRNGGTAIGDLRITPAGAVQIRDGGFVQRAISGAIATVNKAVRAQVIVNSTTGKMRLLVAVGANIASGIWDYDSGLVTASGLQPTTNFQLGIINSATATIHFTALAVDNAVFPGPSGNLPPTCSASVSPSPAAPGATVTLTGTDSDPDGTIASRAWTQTSGTSVTLTGATTATATFTAPSVSGGTTLGFTYTVTDNLGATATSTVSVTITSSTATIGTPLSTQNTNATSGATTTGTVPAGAAVGNKLLAIFFDGGGTLTQTLTASGWQAVSASAVSTSNIGLHVWQKTAVSGDASSTLTITSSVDGTSTYKRTFVVLAVPGARMGNAQATLATTATTAHVAPGQTAVSPSAWALNIFADRGSPGSTSFTLPGNLTVLQHFEHTGGAAVSSVVAYDDLVGAGTVGGNTATGTLSTGNAVMATIVLEPGTGGNPPPIVVGGPDLTNVEPWASFTVGGVDTAQGTATIASIVWTQLQGADLGDLSGYTTGTITLTAPATLYGSSLLLQKTVTDSTGVSAVDQVQVDVLPVTERAVINGVEVPMRILAV